jgi:isoquinoline 1-oxidoreductase alpha subunit
VAYTLKINGKSVSVDAPAEMPLLWALRDVLGLVGTKYGCGVAQCGACTVQIDGQPVRSCQRTVGSVGAGSVTTIEALDADAVGRRLQQAWNELDVAQCGYCQAGQLMSATALLTANPKPSDDQIDMAMTGNICRCLTYNRIRAAIKQAAGMSTAAKETANG